MLLLTARWFLVPDRYSIFSTADWGLAQKGIQPPFPDVEQVRSPPHPAWTLLQG